MPRYLIERTFDGDLSIPDEIVDRNEDAGVTWLQSFVSDDGRTMFCLYEAPTPEAIRRAARANGLPVDRIAQVRVLDPHAYG
jgi:Protein of unknown function (DUF4242)